MEIKGNAAKGSAVKGSMLFRLTASRMRNGCCGPARRDAQLLGEKRHPLMRLRQLFYVARPILKTLIPGMALEVNKDTSARECGNPHYKDMAGRRLYLNTVLRFPTDSVCRGLYPT